MTKRCGLNRNVDSAIAKPLAAWDAILRSHFPVHVKLLFLLPRAPYPSDTGGKIRTAKLLEELSKRHQITCVMFATDDVSRTDLARMQACCARLVTVPWRETRKYTARFYGELMANFLSPLPYTVSKYYDRGMVDALVRESAAGHDLLVCDFLQPSVNLPAVPLRPQIIFEHNVESVIRERQYRLERNLLKKAYLLLDYWKLRRFEHAAARRADHCIMVSDTDCDVMREELGVTNTSSIPTGVDVDYFRPVSGDDAGADERRVVFTGSMDWFPNEDAIRYFLNDIYPRLLIDGPLAVSVVGRNPSTALRRLAAQYPAVEITGAVEDVRPFIGRAAVYVVPLRIGGGTRIKILEAMAMGKPVVSTAVGAEGLPLTNGTDIVIADEPEAFARHVRRLLNDVQARQRLGAAAREVVTSRLTWANAAQEFSEICERVVAEARTELT